MATHYKSTLAARDLGDVFAKIGWARRGIIAWGVAEPDKVAIQYKSEQYGERRIVSCDPLKLMSWLAQNVEKPGSWVKFLDILDRKPERIARLVQEPLFPAGDLAPVVRQSMTPNE